MVIEVHKTLVRQYIEDICKQAVKMQQNRAEVILARLEDGKRLTEEEVCDYANEHNYMTDGGFSIKGEQVSIKLYIGQIIS